MAADDGNEEYSRAGLGRTSDGWHQGVGEDDGKEGEEGGEIEAGPRYEA